MWLAIATIGVERAFHALLGGRGARRFRLMHRLSRSSTHTARALVLLLACISGCDAADESRASSDGSASDRVVGPARPRGSAPTSESRDPDSQPSERTICPECRSLPGGETGDIEPPTCDYELASIDVTRALELGLVTEQALARYSGHFSAPARWEALLRKGLAVSGFEDTTMVEVDVELADEAVLWIGGPTNPPRGTQCDDYVVLNAHVSLRSQDGALAGDFAHAEIPVHAGVSTLSASTDAAEFTGGLDLQLDVDAREPKLRAQLSIYYFDDAVRGRLELQLSELRDLDTGPQPNAAAGTISLDWPGDDCGVDQQPRPVEHVLTPFEQLRATVIERAPYSVAALGGAPTTFELIVGDPSGQACQYLDIAQYGLRAPVRVAGADGRIDVELDMQLELLLDSHQELEYFALSYEGRVIPVDELGSTYGLSGVAFTGFSCAQLRFLYLYDAADSEVKGQLEIDGYVDCDEYLARSIEFYGLCSNCETPPTPWWPVK